jgi:hypothetical protein
VAEADSGKKRDSKVTNAVVRTATATGSFQSDPGSVELAGVKAPLSSGQPRFGKRAPHPVRFFYLHTGEYSNRT